MKKNFLVLVLLFSVTLFFKQSLFAQSDVMVGGEMMYMKMDIIDNAINSKDHTTLVSAVKAGGLVETLKGSGPFTVFAPTNDAFENLPGGTVETLLMSENKGKLTKILTYHVVSGKYNAEDIMNMIRDGNGMASFPTVSGGMLMAKMNGSKNIVIMDEKGNSANISVYDVSQSNGVIHVIDKVLMPN